MDELAVRVEWNGKVLRVLDPISMLGCKLQLVAHLPQGNRRDVMHLRTLLPCVRGFLTEFLHQVERGEIPARHWLNAASHVLKLTTDERAKKIGRKYQINWTEILPLAAITKSRDEKIRRFHELQLRQGYRKPKGISTGL